MGWLERMDARNQRRMGATEAEHDANAEHSAAEEGATVPIGSFLSFVPSLIGLVGLLLVLVGGARQHRREHRS